MKLKRLRPIFTLTALLTLGLPGCHNPTSPTPPIPTIPDKPDPGKPDDPVVPDNPILGDSVTIPTPDDQNLSQESMALLMNFVQSIPTIDGSEMDSNTTLDKRTVVLNNYKQLFVQIVRNDPQFQTMGFDADCVEKYVMPRINNLTIGKMSTSGMTGSSYWFDTGTMNINTNASDMEIIRAFLHETAHVLDSSEHGAEIFTQVLTGVKSDKPRSNWWYNPSQLRPIYELMKQNGEESRFWESLAYDNGVKEIWNEYSPQYKVNGENTPIMTFEEWQYLRQVPLYATYANGMNQLSLDFDKSYYTKDTNFIKKYRSEIDQYAAIGKAEIDKFIQSYGTIENVPAHLINSASLQNLALEMGGSLTQYVYSDPAVRQHVNDIFQNGGNLGMIQPTLLSTIAPLSKGLKSMLIKPVIARNEAISR